MRIVVERPPAGVSVAVQLGKTGLLAPAHRGQDLIFDFALRMKEGKSGQLVLLGPAAQGPANERFVYVNSGTMAGQPESRWTRRAKVKLGAIDLKMAESARRAGQCLEARIAGTGRDGGPSCATVQPLGSGWRITRE